MPVDDPLGGRTYGLHALNVVVVDYMDVWRYGGIHTIPYHSSTERRAGLALVVWYPLYHHTGTSTPTTHTLTQGFVHWYLPYLPTILVWYHHTTMVSDSVKRRRNSSLSPTPNGNGHNAWDISSNTEASALQSFARKGKWQRFIQKLIKTPSSTWSIGDATERPVTTPLHLALAYRPPLTIVETIVQILRDRFDILAPEEVQNRQGQTPLHIAVEAGCDALIVEQLLRGINLVMPAVLRDEQGRTPLLLACTHPILASHWKRKRKSNKHHNQLLNQYQVIQSLLQHYPEAATIADRHGKTPMDYIKARHITVNIPEELRDYQMRQDLPSLPLGNVEQESRDNQSPFGATIQAIPLETRDVSWLTSDPIFLVDLDDTDEDVSLVVVSDSNSSSSSNEDEEETQVLRFKRAKQAIQRSQDKMEDPFRDDEQFDAHIDWMCSCFDCE